MKYLLALTLACANFAEARIDLSDVNPLALIEDPIDTSQMDKPATLKILLEKDTHEALIEVRGKFHVFNPKTQKYVRKISSGTRAFVTPNIVGLKWDRVYPEVFQMRLVPKDKESTLVINGKQYKGIVEIFNIKGKLTLINEVDVENVLRSQLSTTFSTDVKPELLDAIAIVARTNAYHQIAKNRGAFWHLDAHQMGYEGYGVAGQNSELERAIDDTRHMILTYNGAPFPAQYTENSAGKTASYQSIFRKNSYAPNGVEALYAARDRSKNEWHFATTNDALGERTGLGALKEIDLYKDPKSEKVYAVRLSDGHKQKEISYFDLQKNLGESNVPSNDFDVEVIDNRIEFVGHGKGHGVGLCLYSGQELAKQGAKAPQILKTFFPMTKLQKSRKCPEIRVDMDVDQN